MKKLFLLLGLLILAVSVFPQKIFYNDAPTKTRTTVAFDDLGYGIYKIGTNMYWAINGDSILRILPTGLGIIGNTTSTTYTSALVTDTELGYMDAATSNIQAQINAIIGGGGMIYPAAGIAVSTGVAWTTSVVDNSANWNTVTQKADTSAVGLLATVNTFTKPQFYNDDISVANTKKLILQSSTTNPFSTFTDISNVDYDWLFSSSDIIQLETNSATDKTFRLVNQHGTGQFQLQTEGNIIVGIGEVATDYELIFDGNSDNGSLKWVTNSNRFLFDHAVYIPDLLVNSAGSVNPFGVVGDQTELFIDLTATNGAVNDETVLRFESGINIKSAIGFIRTNTFGRGDIVFAQNGFADATEVDLVSDDVVRFTGEGKWLFGYSASAFTSKFQVNSSAVFNGVVYADPANAPSGLVTLAQMNDSIGGTGSVTSVGMSVPTGLTIGGSPITSSGTLALSYTAGYSIPTTTKQGEWDAKQDALTFGIANGNSVIINDASVSDNEYARFTATGIEGRSTASVLADIGALSGGSFTNDFIPKADGLTTLTNSAISDDGTDVVINGRDFKVLSSDPVLTLESDVVYSSIPQTQINARLEYNSGGLLTDMGRILFSKANATDGNTGAYTAFYSKTTGQGIAEFMRISTEPYLLIGYTTNQTSAKIQIDGNGTISGEWTAFSTSDKRLKRNIKPLKSALEIVNGFNVKSFNWNNRAKKLNPAKGNRINYGFIAQELQKTNPELVHEMYNGDYLGVDYEQVIPILVKANQELQQENKDLKKRLSKIEKYLKLN